MKNKTINKKIVIAILIILLVALAIGYAAFGDTLTISGTANAKGTFDLEFQNPEVVKNVGADVDKTTVILSADKDTLTVNAADLSYPGAGVEFSVDIVNVGTMPAEIQAVTPNNITGSDKIKVTGLDAIKTDHPKLEVGDRCNIHFTVEWPVDAGEILEAESSISFGLQIEYTQGTGEVFDGKASHMDADKEGNAINTNTIIPDEPTVKEGILTEIIEPNDYGKPINYKATVKNNATNENEEVSNWKLLYKDENKIYIILDDFLPNKLVPASAGLSTSGTHVVNSSISRDVLLTGLRATTHWSEFANGYDGATAQGTPNFDIIMKSYNEKHNESINTDSTNTGPRSLDNTDTLYVPYTSEHNGIARYWLAAEYPSVSTFVWNVNYNGGVGYPYYNNSTAGIRPVVMLPSSIRGTVGESIEIK